MSRVRRYSRSGLTAPHPRSPTGLSPPAVTRSSGLRLTDTGAARRLPPPPAHSSNPPRASPAGYPARGVWAPPRSLAATKGILSVPRGTEMFQFPRCPPRLTPGCPAVRRAGCPIRTSPDLRLPAPPRGISPRGRVLRRPPTPRHPPCAHHADVLPHVPSGHRRRLDRRPARASGMVPSGRDDAARRPASAVARVCGCPAVPGRCGCSFRLLSCVLCVLRVSARGRAATSPLRASSARLGLHRLPRPQNPAGSAWRIVKVHPTTHVVARSSNLVRSRLPTSDELSQPRVVT